MQRAITWITSLIALVILFGLGFLFRLDLAELAMASAVGIGGPASALLIPVIARAARHGDQVVCVVA